MLLSEFDITFVNQSSIKGRVLADQLAENLGETELLEQTQFPDESIFMTGLDTKLEPTRWKPYFDGAANVFGCGIGAVLVSPKGNQFPASTRLTFP